jgi:hypothetical protein
MRLSELYLVSGVFFQQHVGLALGYDWENGEGPTAIVRSGIGEFLYTGVMYRDPHHVLDGYAGTMLDALGHAHLNNVVITDGELRFEKYYDNGRPHAKQILYNFQHDHDAEWVGEYSIQESDVRGPTRCILNPISEEFFRHNLVLQPLTRHRPEAQNQLFT